MAERWAKLVYPNLDDAGNRFEISTHGRLRNIVTGRIYKPSLLNTGYLCVRTSLGSRAKRINIIIHKAVAITFVENPHNYQDVNHIDGNKQNNFDTNLEWCTNGYNAVHKFAVGLVDTSLFSGENSPVAKLTWEAVCDIRENYIPYSRTNGARSFARKYGVCRKTIESVISNRHWNNTYAEVAQSERAEE